MTANWQKWRLTVSGFLSLMRTQSGSYVMRTSAVTWSLSLRRDTTRPSNCSVLMRSTTRTASLAKTRTAAASSVSLKTAVGPSKDQSTTGFRAPSCGQSAWGGEAQEPALAAPPEGWDNPYRRGRLVVFSARRAVFSARGTDVELVPSQTGEPTRPCA